MLADFFGSDDRLHSRNGLFEIIIDHDIIETGSFANLAHPVETRVHFRHRGGFRLDIALWIEPVRDSAKAPVLWLVRLKPVRSDGGYRAGRRASTATRRGE